MLPCGTTNTCNDLPDWPSNCSSSATRRESPRASGGSMSFALYIIGFVVLIVGLAVGAHLMHIPPQWIGVGVLILIGLGVVTGVTHTRQRDSSS